MTHSMGIERKDPTEVSPKEKGHKETAHRMEVFWIAQRMPIGASHSEFERSELSK